MGVPPSLHSTLIQRDWPSLGRIAWIVQNLEVKLHVRQERRNSRVRKLFRDLNVAWGEFEI